MYRRRRAYTVEAEGTPLVTVYAKTWELASDTGRTIARRRGLDLSTVRVEQSDVEREDSSDHYTPLG